MPPRLTLELDISFLLYSEKCSLYDLSMRIHFCARCQVSTCLAIICNIDAPLLLVGHILPVRILTYHLTFSNYVFFMVLRCPTFTFFLFILDDTSSFLSSRSLLSITSPFPVSCGTSFVSYMYFSMQSFHRSP